MSHPDSSGEAITCVSETPTVPVLEALPGRATDLGGLAIVRLLPRSRRRLVGPWCFLDSFGPHDLGAGPRMDVPPHPHIGLQTVTWLLEGEVRHHDSLGFSALARPGVLNLMTAGRGIAHSEGTPPGSGGRLFGVQLWVALPGEERHTDPSFESHESLPRVDLGGGAATVILGAVAGVRSPGRVFSPIVGAEVALEAGAGVELPLEPGFEHALLPLRGRGELDGQPLDPGTLYYLGTGRRELALTSPAGPARAMLIGGAPFGESVLMWWNFVARARDEIVAARDDWQAGRRFGAVRAYRGDRTPAPPFREHLPGPPSAGTSRP